MGVAVGAGLTAEPWTQPAGSGAHVRRAAGFIAWSENEQGHLCPISMTYAAAPALAANPTLAQRWLPQLASRSYDFGLRPLDQKSGALVGMGMTEKQGGSDVRANTTRAVAHAGRSRGGRRHLPADRPQVVLLRADERRVPRAGADRGGRRLLPRAPRARRRHPQRLCAATAEGQARQPLQRLLGGRARRHLGGPGRRRGSRHPHDPRHGRGHPARLHPRLGLDDAGCPGAGDPPRAAPVRLRRAARRPAPDAERPRRPRARGRGCDARWRCASPTPSTRATRRCRGWGWPWASTGSASAPRPWSPRRWSAWAATATSRRTASLGSTARLRSTRSGRARATSTPSTCCAPSRGSRCPSRRSARSSRWPTATVPSSTRAIARVEDVIRYAAEPGAQAGARRVVEHLAVTLQASLLARYAPTEVADAFIASRLGGQHGVTFGTLDADLSASARPHDRRPRVQRVAACQPASPRSRTGRCPRGR